MALGIPLQEGQLEIHQEPRDRNKVLVLHTASSLGVHLVPWLGSQQLDIGKMGTLVVEAEGRVRTEGQQETLGCSPERRLG